MKRLCRIVLIILLCFTSAYTVDAAKLPDTVKETVGVFEVHIPKKIILDSKTKQATYMVSAEQADFGDGKFLVIEPDTSVTLKSTNKKNVVATISQPAKTWQSNTEASGTFGTITASDISAGSWSGTFNFHISIQSFDVQVTKDATCTDSGTKVYTNSYGDIKTVTIPALGHDYSQVKGKVEATCTTSGYGYSCCSRCGKENPDSTAIIRVEPLGHDFTEKIIEPTCTKQGYITYTCSRCSYSYTTAETKAKGHAYQITKSTKSDCNAKGSITYKCSVCGSSKTVETAAGEHSWDAGVKIPATCTEKGYTKYTCLVCGTTKKENEVNAKGHIYDDGVVTTPATCETYGVKTYTCYNCGKTKTEQIQMYGHMYYGSSYVCSICGKSIIWNFTTDTSKRKIKILSMKDEYKSKLTDITIPSKLLIDDVQYSVEFAKSTYDKLQSVNGVVTPINPQGPFVGNTVVQHVLFEKGSTIEENDMTCMFLSCSSLKTVENIPDSVQIMKMAFEYCTSLESVPKIPSNAVTMSDCFKFCSGLKDVGIVEIPSSVRCIAGIFHSCYNMYGSVYIYSPNIDLVSPSNSKIPFMPCYRAFYLTGRDKGSGNVLKTVVYRYKNEVCYNKKTSNSFTEADLDLYTSTYKNLYKGDNESVIYYYTDNTYATRSSTKTNYKANYSSLGSYVSAYTWSYSTQ